MILFSVHITVIYCLIPYLAQWWYALYQLEHQRTLAQAHIREQWSYVLWYDYLFFSTITINMVDRSLSPTLHSPTSNTQWLSRLTRPQIMSSSLTYTLIAPTRLKHIDYFMPRRLILSHWTTQPISGVLNGEMGQRRPISISYYSGMHMCPLSHKSHSPNL